MKKLIFIIGFIALTGAIYAQSWGASVFGYIQTYPQYELMSHNFPKGVMALRNGDTANPEYKTAVEYFSVSAYSFFLSEKLYMLSYDTCSTCYKYPSVEKPIKRGIYLFRLDKDKWTKVSESIQTDYYSLDSSIDEPNVPQHNIWSSYCYVPVKNITDDYNNNKSLKNGSVKVSDNGEVIIILVNRKWRYDDKYIATESFENKTIILFPNSDGTFTVQ
jgi:hypothetical protein